MSRRTREFKADFDYGARDRDRRSKARRREQERAVREKGGAYGKLWRIVDGAVSDAFVNHPDYLTEKGLRSARTSVTKRVTGTVLSFAEQSAGGRTAAAMEAQSAKADLPVSPTSRDTAGGAVSASPAPSVSYPRVRETSIRLKSRVGPVTDASRKALLFKTAELVRAGFAASKLSETERVGR